MTLRIADRIWDTTGSAGVGVVTLANSPPNGYSSFGSVCSTGDTIYYALASRSTNAWEVGLGTYNSVGPTLTRTTVLASSLGGPAITLNGTTDVLGVWPASQIASNLLSFSVQNVKNFGATGNGTTDDTAAINLAIAALNTAGNGRLYFPSGNYKVTAPLTAISAEGIVFGDGCGQLQQFVTPGPTYAATTITYTPTNSVLFTSNSHSLTFKDINFEGSTSATAGCSAIVLPNYGGATAQDRMNVYNCSFVGFYDVTVWAIGENWFIDQCLYWSWVNWGVHTANALAHDAGGWQITNTVLIGKGASGTAAGIRIDSGGGDHIVNTNILQCVRGIDVVPAISTADLLITNCSFEIQTQYHINLDMSGGRWDNVLVSNCEFDASGGNTISINAIPNTSTGWCFGNLTMGSTQLKFSGAGAPWSTIAVGLIIAGTLVLPSAGAVTDASGGVGGQQFFKFETLFFPTVVDLTWFSPSSSDGALCVKSGQNIRAARFRAVNTNNDYAELTEDSQSGATGGYVQATTAMIVASDCGGASGGSDPVSIRAGGNGTAAEVVQALPAGLLKFTNAANFSANSNVATSLGSIGPAGSHTTVQKWLTIQDSAGNPFYIPCF